MEQLLVCLKKNGIVNIGVLDTKRRELYSIAKALIEGDTRSIAAHVEKALDSGASIQDILRVATFVIGNKKLMFSLTELINVLRYEESKRAAHISILEDVREDV
jgi:alkylhydroperoxidase/carboxymuconolactone decarboxylase family protein YurZ